MEQTITPAAGVTGGAAAQQQSDLKNHGTVNAFAKANGYAVAEAIAANKLSGNPVLRFRDKNGNIVGIVLSRKAGARHPIDSKFSASDAENLYVQEGISDDGVQRMVITTGGSLTFRIPD